MIEHLAGQSFGHQLRLPPAPLGEARIADALPAAGPLRFAMPDQHHVHRSNSTGVVRRSRTEFSSAPSGSPRPAAVMPMAAKVGGVVGNGDDVPGAGGDLAVASRADVGLARLVGLNPAGGHRVVGPQVWSALVHPSAAHNTSPRQMTRAAATIT